MFKAQDLIKQAIGRHKEQIALGCSFGKDSMLVLEMALKVNPNIKVVFENTGVEFPETIRYKKRMKKEWDLNLYETKPLQSFWCCADQYGLPKSRKTGGKGSNSPKCCKDLKEKPALILERNIGVNAIITGLQACESQSRRLLGMRYDNGKAPYMSKEFDGDIVEFCSQRWFTRSENMWKYHPIMQFETKEVWEQTINNNIPINPVYWKWDIDGKKYNNLPDITIHEKGYLLLNGVKALYPRCGCLPCTAYKSWEERLSISHPKLYSQLKNRQDLEKSNLLNCGG